MHVELFTAALDDRYGVGKITSRIGLQADAHLFTPEMNMLEQVQVLHTSQAIDCVLIDEAQFLCKRQIQQLTSIVDTLKIPVLAYGLRTDFLGETFEGSHYLLAWADKIEELKTVCFCGRKANFVVRRDGDGNPVSQGEQIQVGGNDSYESMCRKHFAELIWR